MIEEPGLPFEFPMGSHGFEGFNPLAQSDRGGRRGNNQMDMVRHEHIGVYPHPIAFQTVGNESAHALLDFDARQRRSASVHAKRQKISVFRSLYARETAEPFGAMDIRILAFHCAKQAIMNPASKQSKRRRPDAPTRRGSRSINPARSGDRAYIGPPDIFAAPL